MAMTKPAEKTDGFLLAKSSTQVGALGLHG